MNTKSNNQTQKFERKVSKVFWLILIATFIVGCSRREVIIASSDSPDGKYQCVVTEQPPDWGMGSPYIYRITIKNKNTYKDLEGETYKHNNDSSTKSGFQFKWEANSVAVFESWGESSRPFAKAVIENGKQMWTSDINR